MYYFLYMQEDFSFQQNSYQAFAKLVSSVPIDVTRAALLIATLEYPSFDAEYYLSKLNLLAQQVLTTLGNTSSSENTDSLTKIDAINKVLFEDEHFHGNEEDYYNPDNSFLNKVLDTHVGIPISLSLVYMEVSKRVGLQVEGVGLPFHFVVRCVLPTEILYIDPFEHGLLLSEQDCRERIRLMSHGKIARLPRHMFEPIQPRQMLVRMLGNLKNIYLHREDYKKSLLVSEYLLLLIPDNAREIRDRGMMHLQLKHYAKALRDLKTYLKLEPQASDKHEMQEHIQSVQQIIAMMN
jgi:regulator of sirC expression with transglutaminase-like and TPR domain